MATDHMTDPIFWIPAKYIYQVAAGLLTIILLGLSYAGHKVLKFVKKQAARLERIENVQGVQAENHLSTIQENTGKTVELLQQIQVGQAEMNGYLRGITRDV